MRPLADRWIKIRFSADSSTPPTAIRATAFHTADSHKGYGLGLSIVKSICTFYGWKVDYRYVNHRHTFIVGTGV